jgi:hypothetical protein
VIGFPVNMAAAEALAALHRWLRKSPQNQGRVHFDVAWGTNPDGTTWAWQSYEGPGAYVADLMQPPKPLPSGSATLPSSNPPPLPPPSDPPTPPTFAPPE